MYHLPLELFVEGMLLGARIVGVHHNGRAMFMDEQELCLSYFHGWVSKGISRSPWSAGSMSLPSVPGGLGST